jgi:hypothetical protein
VVAAAISVIAAAINLFVTTINLIAVTMEAHKAAAGGARAHTVFLPAVLSY